MSALLPHWVVTASLLITAVIFLRAVFGRRISARLRYALWLLALLRLLVPGQLFTAPVEAPRVFPGAQTLQALPAPRGTPMVQPRPSAAGEAPAPASAPSVEEPASAPAAQASLNLPALLGWTWGAGTLAVSAAFLVSNLLFARKLRRVRAPLAADGSPRVYVAAGLPSPCLFGVFRPAVYVSPEAAADPARLRHVLVHEATHFRHGDHVWSLLRCAALAVHWWNPLVWLAAVLSRRDAELACDEGALKRLGDGERQAYGSTLLALVTAKPQPGDLLRCATTMTGDKRSLRERIGRIACAPRRWLWAAVASVALAALVCACSFAGTKAPDTEDRPLTADELNVFNSRAFNHGESGVNMLNQLLLLAAETPGDYKRIDLYQLFYNGTGQPMEVTEEERRAVALARTDSEESYLDLIKCPAGEMEEVLQELLGLTLEETDKTGLDRFTYLSEYDAYYDFHSDTNYPGDVTFLSGERKDGKILLYYESGSFPLLSGGDGSLIYPEGTGLNCVTLEEQPEGWFRFLSNWPCDPPAVPTAYPDREPELVIPLEGLEPYEPEAVTVERHTGDVAEQLYHVKFEPEKAGMAGYDVEVYRSTDGNAYAAVVVSETERDCFFTFPADYAQAGWPREAIAASFQDLFGRYGVEIAYYGWLDERYYGTFYDYYTFADDGTPSLLLRARGETLDSDLDGDGTSELTVSGGPGPQLFFQREGQLYLADMDALLHAAWPEAGYTEYGFWNADARYIPLSAQVPLPGSDVTVSAFRTLWFDGENLRLYKDGSVYADHVNIDIDAPGDVLAAARRFVQGKYEALAAEGYGSGGSGDDSGGNFGPGNAVWDDWVLKDLQGPYFEQAGPLRVEIWNLDYETHTTTPDRVILAGGSYLGEDGWCRIGYPGSDYLYFRRDDGGERTFLFSRMENDCSPGSPLFWEDMVYQLEELGLLRVSELDAGEQLALLDSPLAFFERLGDQPRAEQDQALACLALTILENPNAPEYARCAEALSEGGVYAGSLSAGGRAAWERLRDLVGNAKHHVRDAYVEASRKADAEELRELQIPGMSLPELFRFLDESEGTYAVAAMGDLMRRFQKDPAAVLSALAEWENGEAIADSLGVSLYWNKDAVPGALEQAQSLTLDGREAALLERIAAAREAERLEDFAPEGA